METPTIDVSSKEFYGEGYDDSDKRIPDMTIINKQLGRFPHCLWRLTAVMHLNSFIDFGSSTVNCMSPLNLGIVYQLAAKSNHMD